MRVLYRLSKISRKKCTATLQSPVLHRKFEQTESSRRRIVSRTRASHFYVLEISGFQVAAIMFLFAVISLSVGLTVGRGPLGKRLRDAQESILAVDATSPAPPDRPGETTSRTSTPPAANTLNTPAVNPPAPETEESRPESPSAESLNARPADSATRVGPIGPSSAMTPRSLAGSDSPEASPERISLDRANRTKCAATRKSQTRTFTQVCRPDKWRSEKSRPTQGNAYDARSAAPVIAFHSPCHWPRRRQQTVQADSPGKTDRRLLFVCDDLATFCSCFS